MPVYEQKQRILETLENNQVIVVQSPTGSGKTTQIPVILHEAGMEDAGCRGFLRSIVFFACDLCVGREVCPCIG